MAEYVDGFESGRQIGLQVLHDKKDIEVRPIWVPLLVMLEFVLEEGGIVASGDNGEWSRCGWDEREELPNAEVSSCVTKCFRLVRLDWVSPDIAPSCSDFDGVGGEYPSKCVSVVGSSSV